MMVSMRMRGAVISTSVYQGFPSTFTLGRGISVPRFCVYFKGAEGLKYHWLNTMKQIITNPLRAFTLAVSFLFAISLSAVVVEIDGINYEVVTKIKEATVIAKSSGKYTRAVVIPESVEYEGVAYAVTSIGRDAFYQCGLTSVTIPNSVTSIGERAFSGCNGLKSVTIPNSVTSIGYGAFAGCTGLKSVTIPNSVTSIGDQAFYNCSGLTSVHISDLEAWCKIKFGSSFFSNPLYYAGHLYLNGEEIKDLVIPNSVTSIGDYAFYNCDGLTSVTIPNSVTSIGENAFLGCSGLTSVHISDIAAWCKIDFSYATSNPLYCAEHLFLEGEEIKDLVIPNSVTSIGSYAFYGCSGLTSVAIPKSVTNIGEYAFYACYFAAEYFVNQSELTDVNHWGAILVDEEVDGLMIDDNTIVYFRPSVTIAVIPNTVTSIGERAFSGCSGLISVTIPNSVTSIGDYAFSRCSGLTSVTIGNSVTDVGEKAFAYCPELTDVYCYAEKVPRTSNEVFGDSYVEYATLHVPAVLIEDYKATAPWSGFGNIVALTEEEEAAGVEEIEGEDANSNNALVYNINGMKMQNADNLPKGIYIKGGKKFRSK